MTDWFDKIQPPKEGDWLSRVKPTEEKVPFHRQLTRAMEAQKEPSLAITPKPFRKAEHPLGDWLQKVQVPELKAMTTELLPKTGAEMTRMALPFIKKPSLKTAWETRKRALKPGEDMLVDQLKKTADWGMLMSNVPAIRMMGLENIKKTIKEQGLGAGSQGLWNMIMGATGIKWIGGKIKTTPKVTPKVTPKAEVPVEGFDWEGFRPTKPKPEPIPEKPVAPIEKGAVKEPWEISQDKYLGLYRLYSGKDFKGRAIKEAVLEHKENISKALSEGKPVPPEVLKDYPDLKPAVGEKPPELYGGFYTPRLVELMEKWFEKPPKGERLKPKPDPIIEEIRKGLESAKPLRKKQEREYTKERGRRLAKSLEVRKKVGGLKGFYAEKAQFKGEMPKVEFEPTMEKLSPEKVDYIVQKATDSPYLAEFEKLSAREGLVKALEGSLPTEGELSLLRDVFGEAFTKTLLDKRTTLAKAKEFGLELINVPRTIMASFDLSFGLRQGIFAAPKFRKEFYNSFKKQFKLFGSERAYHELMQSIREHPRYKLAREGRISFTDIEGKFGALEEPYMGIQLGEKIPLVGRGIRASGRAYTGFANKYRFDIFNAMVDDAIRIGLDPIGDPFLLRNIGDLVNTMTGRGTLTRTQSIAPILNAVFFSPRLMKSRLSLMNPVYYVKLPAYARQQALKSLLGFAGFGVTTLTGLSMIPGVEVGKDPTSADFGKIKIGDKVRIDLWGGFQPYVRAGAQIISGKYTSTVSGKVTTLGEGYRPLNRFEILLRQIESKYAPVTSLAITLFKGQDWRGRPLNIPKEVFDRFKPMVLADMIELYKEDPKLLPLGSLAVFGVGLQTYETYPKEVHKINKYISDTEYKGNMRYRKARNMLRKLNSEFWEVESSDIDYKDKQVKLKELKEKMREWAIKGLAEIK